MLFSNLIAEDTNAFQQLNRGRFFLFLASLHRYRLVIEKKKQLCRSWLRDTGIVVVILITRAPVAASIVILSIVWN